MVKRKNGSANLRPLLRRLVIGMVIFPPIVALTNYEPKEEPRSPRKIHGERIVIPGSALYLDRNPSF